MQSITSNLLDNYNNQYDGNMSQWRETGAKKKVENIIKICSNKKYTNVLEVGAGDGSILNLLSKQKFGQSLYAIEISKSGVEKIKEKNITNLKDVSIFDGYKIPYPDKHFDLLILSHVLEHVEHERVLLREIARVSKEQVIEVPREFRFGADNKINHFLSYGHINIYTPTNFRFLLKTEGFEIKEELLQLYSFDSYAFGKKSLLKKIVAFVSYSFKTVMLAIPIRAFKELYCSTITIRSSNNSKLSIF